MQPTIMGRVNSKFFGVLLLGAGTFTRTFWHHSFQKVHTQACQWLKEQGDRPIESCFCILARLDTNPKSWLVISNCFMGSSFGSDRYPQTRRSPFSPRFWCTGGLTLAGNSSRARGLGQVRCADDALALLAFLLPATGRRGGSKVLPKSYRG